MNQDLIIAAASACFGGVAGYASSYVRGYFDEKRRKRDEVNSFLRAIRCELWGLWNRYNSTFGCNLVNQKGIFRDYYPIYENYFSLYDSNTHLLTNLPSDLSEGIIKTYTLAKGLKDSFMYNNFLLDKESYYVSQLDLNEIYSEASNRVVSELYANADTLRHSHFELKEMILGLILLIKKQLNEK